MSGRDFGYAWREPGDWRTWRLSWDEGSGVLFASRIDGRRDYLAVVPDATEVRRLLGDWPALCGRAGSLTLLRARLTGST